jgi:hypothetical protein
MDFVFLTEHLVPIFNDLKALYDGRDVVHWCDDPAVQTAGRTHLVPLLHVCLRVLLCVVFAYRPLISR